jgi:hypothetical protein
MVPTWLTTLFPRKTTRAARKSAPRLRPNLVQLEDRVNPAVITINDVMAAEGNAGTTMFTFTVSLDVAEAADVTVDYATSEGSAKAGTDFQAVATTQLTIPAGDKSKTITVLVNGDETVELDETFFVDLSNPSANATIGDAQGMGTIQNDDSATLSIAPAMATEGTGIVFTATLTKAADTDVTVTLTPSKQGGDTATETTDFATAAQVITITAGTTSGTATVATVADNTVELDETFTATLSGLNAGGRDVTIATGTAAGTIQNDDLATVSINGPSVAEGGTLAFSVTIDNPVDVAVTADRETADGVTNPATAGTDYTALAAANVQLFAADSTAAFAINVTTTADVIVELDEQVRLILSNLAAIGRNVVFAGGGATLTGTGTIQNDDSATVSIADASAGEGLGVVFTATLTNPVDTDVTIKLTPSKEPGDSATENTDFATAPQTITILAGSLTGTATVATVADGKVEADETFTATLSDLNAGGRAVTVADGVAAGTILNGDAATVSIAPAMALEGTGIVFTATLSAATDVDITVTLTPSKQAGDTATETTDFATAPQVITITAGTTSGTATVATVSDDVVELDETFTATLSGLNANGRNVTIGTGTAAGTIQNDDAATVSIAPAMATEGTGIVFTATLTKAVDVDVTVTLTPSKQGGDTATGTTDFDTAPQLITITAGTLSGTATVATVADNVVELDETFTATLGGVNAGGRNVTIGTGTATGTILNDDAATVSIADAAALEGNGVTFTATLTNPVDTDLTITLTPSKEMGDKAAENTDFVTTPQTITILAGALTGTATVATVADGKVEQDETFTATLSGLNAGGRNVTIADGVATGTILNGDAAEFSIAAASAVEGNAIVFTITLSSPVEADTSVTVTTADLTAVDGVDYTGLVAVVVLFPAGTTSQMVMVPTTADLIVEADETFKATLGGLNDGGLTGAVTISATNGSATGTILNDDTATLTVADVTQDEDAGTMTFTVTLTGDLQDGFTVDYKTTSGTATAGSDFVATTGTLTFVGMNGESQTFMVTINADTTVELDEAFTVSLFNVVPAAGADPADIVATDTGLGTITNDDAAEFKITKLASATEGGPVQFMVTLTNPVDVTTSVTVTTADGTAMVANNDYTPLMAQTVTFGPGVTSQLVNVLTTADNSVEADETFTITLGGLNDGGRKVTISATDNAGTGTIVNDDAAEFKITKTASAVEGGPVTFTITLSNPVDVDTSVTVTTADGTAAAASDYTALAGQVVLFPAGTTSKTVMVMTTADTVVEADETFTITLGGLVDGGRPVTISATDNTGTGTITNDDTASLTVADVAQAEDGGGITFTVTLNGDVQGGFTVQFKSADGTATVADADYLAALGTLTFAGTNGESKTFTVTVNPDNKVEADETFAVSLFNVVPNNALIPAAAIDATDTATGTITNDDSTTLTIQDVAQSEAGGPITFTVTLSNPVQGGFTVNFQTADGTALVVEGDYTAAAGTLAFAGTAGETKTFQVVVLDDNLVEGDEFFTVSLSNVVTLGPGVSAAKIDATDTAKGVIVTDDTATISLTASTSAEGTNLIYTVTLSNPVSKDVSVDFSTLAGVGVRPATAGADFTVTASKLTFAAKTQMVTIAVPIIDDRRVEGSEQFDSKIANVTTDASLAGAVTIAKAQDTATITDNDMAVFSFTQAANSRPEDNVTGVTATVQLTINAVGAGVDGLDQPITVRVTPGGTATLGVDYNFTNPTDLTFPAGNFTTTTQNIAFDLVEDLNKEGDETIVFTLAMQADATVTQAAIGAPATHTFTITSDDETVRTYDATAAGDYRFVRNADNVQLFLGATLLSTDAIGTQAILLNGTANTAQPVEGVESATVDYVNGSPVPTGGIAFNANGPAVGERFIVANGAFTGIVNTFTGSQTGTIALTGTATDTLTYQNVDAVELNVTSVGSLQFLLPAATSTALLEDPTAGDGFSQIRSGNGTFATTKFRGPTTVLNVQRGTAADTLAVGALPDNNSALIVGDAAARFQTITQTGPVTANGEVRYFATDIAVQNGANVTAAGAVELNATTTVTLGDTTVSGATFAQTNGAKVLVTGSATVAASAAAGDTIVFTGSVDGPGSLTANTAGNTVFNLSVGAGTPLANLTTNAGGITAVNGPIVQTSVSQTFGDPVRFSAPTGGKFLATGGTIAFNDTLDPTTAGLDLVIGGPNVDITAAKAIGGATPISTLTVANAKNATFNGALSPTRLVQTTGTGTTTFNAPVTAASGANAAAGGAINLNTTSLAFNGNVTTTNPAGVIVLTLQGGTATEAKAAAITTSKLYLNGSGAFTLDAPGNTLTTVGAGAIAKNISTASQDTKFNQAIQDLQGELFVNLTAGSVSVRDSGDLIIRFEDQANQTPPIRVLGGGSVTLTSGKDFSAEDAKAYTKVTDPAFVTPTPLFDVPGGQVQINPGVDNNDGLTTTTRTRFVTEANAKLVTIGQFDPSRRTVAASKQNPFGDLDNVAKDIFTVRPAQGAAIRVNGNSPVVADGRTFSPFDTLNPFFAGAPVAAFVIIGNAGDGDGKYTFGAPFNTTLEFTSIETLGGFQAEGFVVQTAPRVGVDRSEFAARVQFQQLGTDIPTSLTGAGVITNPFVVTPNTGTAGGPVTPPGITFAEIDGDNTPDLILSAGAGDAPLITIIKGSRLLANLDLSKLAASDLIAQFFAFEETFRGGLNVAAGDFDNDGRDEVAVGAGIGGGPRIAVFRIDPTTGSPFDNATFFANKFGPLNFFPYESTFRGGVNVAIGDVNGDGSPEIIAGAGFRGGPRVRVFDVTKAATDGGPNAFRTIADYFAYDPNFRGGVFVSAGRFDGDQIADIATAPGPGGGPHVRVFLGSDQPGQLLTKVAVNFFAFPQTTAGGGLIPSQNAKNSGVSGVAFGGSTDGSGGRRSILVSTPRGTGFEVVRFTFTNPFDAGTIQTDEDFQFDLAQGTNVNGLPFDSLRAGGSVGGFAVDA